MIDGLRSRAREHAATGDAKPPRGIGRWVALHGVSADAITALGLLLSVATGIVIGAGALWPAVGLLTVGGLMDSLDGAVAKAAGTSSRRGAFFDSVADRVADAFVFGGVAWYLAGRPDPRLAILPLAVLGVSAVVSYERAKAESLGMTARGGLMERAERLILLGVGLGFHVVLVPVLWVLLVLTSATAVGRFARVWRQAGSPLHVAQPQAARTWRPAKVDSRWRTWRETGRVGDQLRSATRLRYPERRSSGTVAAARRASRLRAVLDGDSGRPRRARPAARAATTRAFRRRYDGQG